jgi:hypothetical protein
MVSRARLRHLMRSRVRALDLKLGLGLDLEFG